MQQYGKCIIGHDWTQYERILISIMIRYPFVVLLSQGMFKRIWGGEILQWCRYQLCYSLRYFCALIRIIRFYWWHLSAIILPKLSHKIIFTFITSVLLFEPTVTPTVMMCIDSSVIFVLSLLYKLENNLIFLIKCSFGRYVLPYNEVVSSVTV